MKIIRVFLLLALILSLAGCEAARYLALEQACEARGSHSCGG